MLREIDPLVTLRALVMERYPVRVRWRLRPGGFRRREATGTLAWAGVDLVLTDMRGTEHYMPLACLVALRDADTGRLLWSPRQRDADRERRAYRKP